MHKKYKSAIIILRQGGVVVIIEVRMNNCLVFSNPVALSLQADMRNKRLGFNVYSQGYFNILKAVEIYGPNNVGKSCLVSCIRYIKRVMCNSRPLNIHSNLFTKNNICVLGLTFMEAKRVYNFDFKYDASKKEFLYERFAELIKDKNSNEKEILYLEKDSINDKFYFKDNKELTSLLKVIGRQNIAAYLIDTDQFQELGLIKKILTDFAARLDVINMNNIPLNKTIDILKTKDDLQKKVVAFIKKADLDLDDYKYSRELLKDLKVELDNNAGSSPEEKILSVKENMLDQLCLVSVHKGVSMPSMLIDSTGTKKIVALASFIIEALEKGRVLVVDELDSSLHFKLSRAIVALFNNELNINGQLIFTAHDISLMDCKKLFRKEQIWFIYKNQDNVYVYSLKDFTAREHGVRDTSDIIELYKKGVFGALPEPDLIENLLEVRQ